MNRKLTLIAIPLLVLLCTAVMGQALAQTRVPGVKAQDNFIYKLTAHWSSDDPNETMPSYLTEFNETKQYEIIVGAVSGVNVTMTHVWTFNNGTENPYLITIDVDSGAPYYLSNSIPPFEAIVGTGLSAGDVLNPTGNDTTIIFNQTVSRQYATSTRPANILTLTNQTSTGTSNVTYIIDQETGMLVEETINAEDYSPHDTVSITWTLVETNVWNAGSVSSYYDPFSLAIIIGVIIAVVIITVLYISNRRRHRH